MESTAKTKVTQWNFHYSKPTSVVIVRPTSKDNIGIVWLKNFERIGARIVVFKVLVWSCIILQPKYIRLSPEDTLQVSLKAGRRTRGAVVASGPSLEMTPENHNQSLDSVLLLLLSCDANVYNEHCRSSDTNRGKFILSDRLQVRGAKHNSKE